MYQTRITFLLNTHSLLFLASHFTLYNLNLFPALVLTSVRVCHATAVKVRFCHHSLLENTQTSH